jgi:hypothetical protein
MVVVGLPAILAPASAYADDDACLDASEHARELLGKNRLLDARAALRLCAASSCEDAIRLVCDERLAEVVARLPTIIFDAKDHAGADVPGVTLTVDGSPQEIGREITLEPGEHVFVFDAPGQPQVAERLVLAEREKGRREHVTMGALPRAAVEAPRVEPLDPWRIAGWAAIAGGAVGIGIGAAFGITAIGDEHDAHCDSHDVCADPRSRHDARTAATVSTIAFASGATLAAAGAALVLFVPHHTSSVGFGPTGVAWRGSF